MPTALLDVSVQYKGESLNNTTGELFAADGSLDTGVTPLGDEGRKTLVISQTGIPLTLRLIRQPKAPQHDPSKYPILGGDFPFGPVTGSARVLIMVAEPTK